MRKTLLAELATPSVTATPFGATPNRGLAGAAASRVDPHVRALIVHARAGDGDEGATGTVTFVHQSPDGVNRFVASVSCLSISDTTTDTVELSGSVTRGQNTAGNNLAGRDVAFTVHTASDPSQFSLPRFGHLGTLRPCSGGRPETAAQSTSRPCMQSEPGPVAGHSRGPRQP